MINFNTEIEDAFLTGELGTAHTNLHLYPESGQEGLSSWFQPGNSGNSGGASPKPHGTSVWTPGNPTTVTVKPAGPYDNFYFVKDLPIVLPPSRLVSVRQHSIVNLSGWQALEFEQELHWGGCVYNMAWQFDLANKLVRYFDYTDSVWLQTRIALPPLNGLLTVAEFAVDPVAQTTTHVALTINGVRYLVNVTQKATPKTGLGTKLTIAEQMDSTAVPVPITMTIGQCDLMMV